MAKTTVQLPIFEARAIQQNNEFFLSANDIENWLLRVELAIRDANVSDDSAALVRTIRLAMQPVNLTN